jgi:hypothetical protein
MTRPIRDTGQDVADLIADETQLGLDSVDELADEGQAFEAELVQGLEDAADHPEKPVPSHEHDRRPPGPDERS